MAASPAVAAVLVDGLPAETEYVYPPSQSILCPVCQEVCRDPLITSVCHHSFCTACIFQALEREAACPLCRHALTNAGEGRKTAKGWRTSTEPAPLPPCSRPPITLLPSSHHHCATFAPADADARHRRDGVR